MQRSKPRIPNNRQKNRQTLLSQNTTSTEEAGQTESKGNNDSFTSIRAKEKGQAVDSINRDMYPSTAQIPWDKFGVYIAIALAIIGFIWYLATQDSAVKNLADDTKELKKKSEETKHFSIETTIRLGNVEQRLSSVEQREKNRKSP